MKDESGAAVRGRAVDYASSQGKFVELRLQNEDGTDIDNDDGEKFAPLKCFIEGLAAFTIKNGDDPSVHMSDSPDKIKAMKVIGSFCKLDEMEAVYSSRAISRACSAIHRA